MQTPNSNTNPPSVFASFFARVKAHPNTEDRLLGLPPIDEAIKGSVSVDEIPEDESTIKPLESNIDIEHNEKDTENKSQRPAVSGETKMKYGELFQAILDYFHDEAFERLSQLDLLDSIILPQLSLVLEKAHVFSYKEDEWTSVRRVEKDFSQILKQITGFVLSENARMRRGWISMETTSARMANDVTAFKDRRAQLESREAQVLTEEKWAELEEIEIEAATLSAKIEDLENALDSLHVMQCFAYNRISEGRLDFIDEIFIYQYHSILILLVLIKYFVAKIPHLNQIEIHTEKMKNLALEQASRLKVLHESHTEAAQRIVEIHEETATKRDEFELQVQGVNARLIDVGRRTKGMEACIQALERELEVKNLALMDLKNEREAVLNELRVHERARDTALHILGQESATYARSLGPMEKEIAGLEEAHDELMTTINEIKNGENTLHDYGHNLSKEAASIVEGLNAFSKDVLCQWGKDFINSTLRPFLDDSNNQMDTLLKQVQTEWCEILKFQKDSIFAPITDEKRSVGKRSGEVTRELSRLLDVLKIEISNKRDKVSEFAALMAAQKTKQAICQSQLHALESEKKVHVAEGKYKLAANKSIEIERLRTSLILVEQNVFFHGNQVRSSSKEVEKLLACQKEVQRLKKLIISGSCECNEQIKSLLTKEIDAISEFNPIKNSKRYEQLLKPEELEWLETVACKAAQTEQSEHSVLTQEKLGVDRRLELQRRLLMTERQCHDLAAEM